MTHAVENQNALPCMNRQTQLRRVRFRACCRSAILLEGLRPTACRGMFDAMFEGFTKFWIE
jgi:hypothetical protein